MAQGTPYTVCERESGPLRLMAPYPYAAHQNGSWFRMKETESDALGVTK